MSLENTKVLIRVFILIGVVILISGIVKISLSGKMKGLFKNPETKKVFEVRPKAYNINKIYLKSGGFVQGVIVSDSDPMEVKVIFDKGEGSIFINKSDILKIIVEGQDN